MWQDIADAAGNTGEAAASGSTGEAAPGGAGGNRVPGAFRRFLVLVPHRDIRPALRDWQAKLFAAGIPSVWAFPPAAPLAIPDRPLAETACAALARDLRGASGTGTADAAGGRPFFTAGGTGAGGAEGRLAVVEAGDLLVWGLPLHDPDGKVLPPLPDGLPQIVLCAFVSGREEAAAFRCRAEALPPPVIRFGAAAVANLVLENPEEEGGPFGACSFSWRLGKFSWLPARKRGGLSGAGSRTSRETY